MKVRITNVATSPLNIPSLDGIYFTAQGFTEDSERVRLLITALEANAVDAAKAWGQDAYLTVEAHRVSIVDEQ